MIVQNRRDVIQGIGATALLGATAPAAAMQGANPNKKLGYAIVGLGSYATRQIMPRIKECEHARLAALVSGTPAKLEKFGAEYGIPATHHYNYQNYESMRDNPDIDIVYVVLPNSMHAEYVIRAAEAGKHVMCEKPMAISSKECEAMIAACRKAGKKLMIGYRCHFEQYNLLATKMARGGEVGPTRHIIALHGFNARPNQWRLDRPLSGGGSLMDIGIYSLNAVRYLSGEEPVEVTAFESTDKSDPRFKNVEDRIDFMLRFPSGILASCTSSYSAGMNSYRVVGRDGWIDLDPATPYSGHAMNIRKDGATTRRELPPPAKSQFVGQLDHLAECITSGREPIVAGEEGLKDLRIIEAIYQSAREGRSIKLSSA